MNLLTDLKYHAGTQKYRYSRISGISADHPKKTLDSRLDPALKIRPSNLQKT